MADLVLPLADSVSQLRRATHETNRLATRLRHQLGRAIADFGMIEDGDKVVVCPPGARGQDAVLAVFAPAHGRLAEAPQPD